MNFECPDCHVFFYTYCECVIHRIAKHGENVNHLNANFTYTLFKQPKDDDLEVYLKELRE